MLHLYIVHMVSATSDSVEGRPRLARACLSPSQVTARPVSCLMLNSTDTSHLTRSGAVTGLLVSHSDTLDSLDSFLSGSASSGTTSNLRLLDLAPSIFFLTLSYVKNDFQSFDFTTSVNKDMSQVTTFTTK